LRSLHVVQQLAHPAERAMFWKSESLTASIMDGGLAVDLPLAGCTLPLALRRLRYAACATPLALRR